jgi:hypothetical protein
MDWIHVAQDMERWHDLVKVVVNFWVAENAENFLTSCGALSCSRSTLLHGLVSYILRASFSTVRLTGQLKEPEVNITGVKCFLPK